MHQRGGSSGFPEFTFVPPGIYSKLVNALGQQTLKRLQGKMRELHHVFDDKPAAPDVSADVAATLRAA